MRTVAIWMSRLLDLVLWRQRDARLDEEIAEHLAHLRAEHERRGLTPAEADLAARRSFGGVDQTKRRYQDQRGWPSLESLGQDVRFAVRYLVRDRAFAVPVVLVLALGIGVGHLFLTVTYAHILRGLPVEDVERVLAVSTVDTRGATRGVSYLDFLDLRRAQRMFADLAAYANAPVTIGDDAQVPDRVQAAFTTASGFATIGVRPLLGRAVEPADEAAGAAPVVVLTERVWRGRYGGAASVVGREVLVNGAATAVIGVISDRSGFPSGAAVFLPLRALPGVADATRDTRALQAFGRLTPHATPAAAAADVDAIAVTLSRQFPASHDGVRLVVEPINYRLLGGAWAVRGYLPFITAGLVVLAVASTNAGNLLLAGAAGRAREVAVRTALGASRARIVRQLLVEALLMTATAATLGMAVSRAGVGFYRQRIPDGTLPYWFDYSLNPWLMVALAGMGLATVVVFAVLPATHASRTAVIGVLNDGGRADTGSRATRLGGSAFLGLQLGLAVVLVVQVGISMVTRNDRLATDPRLDDPQVLTGTVSLPAVRYATADGRRQFMTQLLDRMRALPTVVGVTLASHGPVAGGFERRLAIEGRRSVDGAPDTVQVVEIGPRYFATLDIGVVRGQEFTTTSVGTEDSGVLVNERFAARHFPGQDPIGQRLSLRPPGAPGPATWQTVVGVVPDIRHSPAQAAAPVVYAALLSAGPVSATLFVRSSHDGAALAPSVRESLRQLDAMVPLDRARSLAVATRDATWAARVSAMFAMTVCSSAVVLATSGLFAVVSHRIARRRREIGLRMALGADGRRVAAVVIGSVRGAVVAGLVLGVIGVLAWDRAFAPTSGEARGVSALAGTLAALTAVVLLGCAVPLVRAWRMAPAEALRRE